MQLGSNSLVSGKPSEIVHTAGASSGRVNHSILITAFDSLSLENILSAVGGFSGFYFVLIKHGCGFSYTNSSKHMLSVIKGNEVVSNR